MKKPLMLRLFFVFEVVVFMSFYFYGANGVFAVAQLKKESNEIERQIQFVMQEVEELQKTIIAWRSDPFYKEKTAREKLHMAREGETIYCMR